MSSTVYILVYTREACLKGHHIQPTEPTFFLCFILKQHSSFDQAEHQHSTATATARMACDLASVVLLTCCGK